MRILRVSFRFSEPELLLGLAQPVPLHAKESERVAEHELVLGPVEVLEHPRQDRHCCARAPVALPAVHYGLLARVVAAGVEADEGLHHLVEAGVLLYRVWHATVRPSAEVEKSDYLLLDGIPAAIDLPDV